MQVHMQNRLLRQLANPFLQIGLVASLIVLLSVLISIGYTEYVDVSLLHLFRGEAPAYEPRGSTSFQNSVRDITALGSGVVLTPFTIVVVCLHFMRKQRHTGLFIGLTILLGWLAMEGLKICYHRERPVMVPHLVTHQSLSLPSGHSMMSTVVFLTLAIVHAGRTDQLFLKVIYYCLAVILALLIGATRVYLGVHHPSDVLVGWLYGILWVQIAFFTKKTWLTLE